MNTPGSNSARSGEQLRGNEQNQQNLPRGSVNSSALLEEIRRLGFVKNELELYLDTHPDCKVALDYYYQTVDALKSLMDEYHATNSPLIAAESRGGTSWAWVDAPWPWHRAEDNVNGGTEEERQ